MSYILDALKKSEKERRQASGAAQTVFDDGISAGARKRSLWPYLVVAAVALSAGVFASWVGIFHPARTGLTPGTPSEKPQDLTARDSFPAPSVKSENLQMAENKVQEMPHPVDTGRSGNSDGAGQKQEARDSADSHKKIAHPPKKQALNRNEGRSTQTVVREEDGVDRIPAEPKPDNHVAVAVPNKIYTLGELPMAIRQELPSFSVSVFLYSDEPASRLININGHTLKEGQYLADGLKLEEIIPNGLIFSYHNFRFHVDLK
jgi:general secretion pathway protein B